MFTAIPATEADSTGYAGRKIAGCVPDPRQDLLRQAGVANALGSPFVSEVLTAAFRQLGRARLLDATIAVWPLDPAASAMALRLNAGLHALARRGTFADLSALYAGKHFEFDRAIGEALEHGEPTLLVWMSHPTQTNEVRRSSAFMAALCLLTQEFAMPVELLEVGASAGLNLLVDRYAHRLGDTLCGDTASPLLLSPQWHGVSPPQADVRIAGARGADLRPLSVDDPHTRERLMSYIWPGDDVRADCLRHAIGIARDCIPQVDRCSAAPWLAEQLQVSQPAGTMRVIQHSMVMQYLPDDELEAAISAIREAGRQATPQRPLVRMGLEWDRERRAVNFCMTRWAGRPDDGDRNILAQCHPYGAAIEWFGNP